MNYLTSATIENPALSGPITALDGTTFIQNAIPSLISLLLTVGVVYFFFQFILGGLDYIGAGGDKAKVEAAKGKLGSAATGVLVMFLFFAIITLAGDLLGADLTLFDLDKLRIQ